MITGVKIHGADDMWLKFEYDDDAFVSYDTTLIVGRGKEEIAEMHLDLDTLHTNVQKLYDDE